MCLPGLKSLDRSVERWLASADHRSVMVMVESCRKVAAEGGASFGVRRLGMAESFDELPDRKSVCRTYYLHALLLPLDVLIERAPIRE